MNKFKSEQIQSNATLTISQYRLDTFFSGISSKSISPTQYQGQYSAELSLSISSTHGDIYWTISTLPNVIESGIANAIIINIERIFGVIYNYQEAWISTGFGYRTFWYTYMFCSIPKCLILSLSYVFQCVDHMTTSIPVCYKVQSFNSSSDRMQYQNTLAYRQTPSVM